MSELYLQYLGTGHDEEEHSQGGISITEFPYTIGRHADCNHHIKHAMISRRHCKFFLRNGEVWVEDCGSRNGTYLNGEPVREARPIRAGNLLNLAHLFFFEAHQPEAAAAPAVCDEAAIEADGASGPPRRVLVVEDNTDAAATLALVLKRWGHEVEVAHNGQEALAAAEAQQPDTVLLDIHLPGMDGCRVAERLRSEAGLENAKLVAITGYDVEKVSCLSEEAGFDQILTKPVEAEALQEALRGPDRGAPAGAQENA